MERITAADVRAGTFQLIQLAVAVWVHSVLNPILSRNLTDSTVVDILSIVVSAALVIGLVSLVFARPVLELTWQDKSTFEGEAVEVVSSDLQWHVGQGYGLYLVRAKLRRPSLLAGAISKKAFIDGAELDLGFEDSDMFAATVNRSKMINNKPSARPFNGFVRWRLPKSMLSGSPSWVEVEWQVMQDAEIGDDKHRLTAQLGPAGSHINRIVRVQSVPRRVTVIGRRNGSPSEGATERRSTAVKHAVDSRPDTSGH